MHGCAIEKSEPADTARRAPEPDLWGLVGNTPLLPLEVTVGKRGVSERGSHAVGSRILVKAEWFNPGGSVKDRPAREIMRAGLALGVLPRRRLLDASSGNTAIAYAMLGAAAGIGVTVCVPRNASIERRRLLAIYGAEVVETDPLEGSDGAIRRARELAAADPDRYWYADQYANPANPRAHYEGTGPELWRDTHGAITHLVAGLGTSGTLMGAGRYLRERRDDIQLVSVEPDGPFHGLEGLKHMATAIVPPIYDAAVADMRAAVTTEEAEDEARALARERGLFLGWSAAAAVVVGKRLLAASTDPDVTIVVIAPDAGTRYLSEAERLLGTRS